MAVADDLVLGVDTHKDVHVAAVLDRLGRRLAIRDFPATDAGNAQMARWLDSLGTVTDAGVAGKVTPWTQRTPPGLSWRARQRPSPRTAAASSVSCACW